MNQKEIINLVKGGELSVDLVKMSLTQRNSIAPIIYRGEGLIWRSTTGFHFKLYAKELENSNLNSSMLFSASRKAGYVYREEDYFDLTGVTSAQIEWTSSRILPKMVKWSTDSPPIFQGVLRQIISSGVKSETGETEMYFINRNGDIPKVSCPANFRAEGCEFSVSMIEEDIFLLKASHSLNHIKMIDGRIEESLSFLIGKAVFASLIVTGEGFSIRNIEEVGYKVKLPPPLSFNRWHKSDIYWEIFSKYFSFIVNDNSAAGWHPCSGFLRLASESSRNSIEAWGIGLCIAIEGIADLVEFQQDSEEVRRIKNLRKSILDFMKEKDEYRFAIERVGGILGSLESIRAVDRLHALAKRKTIKVEHIKIWRRLRNGKVHPSSDDGMNGNFKDFESEFRDIQTVALLMYQVVFYLIGYVGLHTDYSSEGYPDKNYPILD